MAWGKPEKDAYKEDPSAGPHTFADDANPGVPVEHRETLYYRNPNTQYYPGFETQGYQRPVPAPSDEGHRHGGVVTNVGHHVEDQILTDRGTESHGVDVDSQVGPKDQPEALAHNRRDNKHEILPDDKSHLDEEYPVPVRIVNQEPLQDVDILIERFNVGSNSPPVKLLSKDRRRTVARIATIFVTGTTAPSLISSPASNPATAGFPLPTFSNGVFEVHGTNELWVKMDNATDSFGVSVYQERARNADPHMPD